MSKLKEFEDYLKAYSFTVFKHLLNKLLDMTLMVKSTTDWRKKPTYEEVLDISYTISLGTIIQTARLGWIKKDTCTFKLK